MAINLSIKGVPELTAERLRARAERNHRSLQGELMAIVERAAAETPTPPDLGAGLVASTWQPAPMSGQRRGSKTIEQIAAEHLARWPEPFRGLPAAVDIVRADRDHR